jgi:hypothetical protein
MHLRRTIGLLTSFLLLQSSLVAAGGVGCMAEGSGMPAGSSTMGHATMGRTSTPHLHANVSSVLAQKTRATSTGSETATCIGMNPCTSSSEVAVAYVAIPVKQSITSHALLSASAPHSRATTPDVPPPRT